MKRKSSHERIIEQLSNGVAITISLQRVKKYEEAQDHFAIELERFLRIPYPQFVVDVTEDWLETFFRKYGSEIEIIDSFASLLLVGAELAFDSHRITEGFLLVTKCQRLFSIIIEQEGELSESDENKIGRLAVLISKFSN